MSMYIYSSRKLHHVAATPLLPLPSFFNPPPPQSATRLHCIVLMPSHGRKKSKKTGVLGQALISDRFGRKGVFRASDANLPENAKQLLANQHFLDDEEKMSTKLRSVFPPPPS